LYVIAPPRKIIAPLAAEFWLQACAYNWAEEFLVQIKTPLEKINDLKLA